MVVGSYARRASVLRAGGSSWGLWTWRAQDDACDECDDLDGEEYEQEVDVPERLHPNCQCEVEYVIHELHKRKWRKLHRTRHGNKRPKHAKRKPKMFTTRRGGKKR